MQQKIIGDSMKEFWDRFSKFKKLADEVYGTETLFMAFSIYLKNERVLPNKKSFPKLKEEDELATSKQINLLKQLKIKVPENLSKEEATKLISEKLDKEKE